MSTFNRRKFISRSGAAVAGSVVANPVSSLMAKSINPAKKKRLVLVGTGIRGAGFWGKRVVAQYSDYVEFIGLCDINPGRLEFVKKYMGVDCPTFTDFDEMMKKTSPDMVIVTTVDATHHEFIVKGLNYGADVLTEKPLTTDEDKCAAILKAEKESGKQLIVGFNYRYASLPTKLKEILLSNEIGKVTSVDFNWYLNVYHGASYFRRWHGLRNKGGTLLVHKATHHFDLLNWLIDSDPVEVFAYGSLEHYGKNNAFSGDKCRTCPHKEKCKFYWDITRDQMAMDLYVANENYDGYIRDNCLWREEIDIYDKMAVQIKYANNVQVSYSLTTYSPYEGWRIAFNGFNGRLDSWEGIPWRKEEKITQAELHAKEMSQEEHEESSPNYEEAVVMENFGDYKKIQIHAGKGGHGGGDKPLQDRIFVDPDMPDPMRHAAGTRDGVMSIMIGIAARKSIEEKRPVRIEELTSLKPSEKRL
jgi:predicted dehydrogenase